MNYIAVRLDKLVVEDEKEGVVNGPEGEIQYLGVVSTGNANEEPIVVQKTGFPLENWYEAEGNGVNSSILGGYRAIPLFCFPEEQMGNRLLITITGLEDDETSSTAIVGHQIAASIGTVVATATGGPAIGELVDRASTGIQQAIEDGADKDVIGIHVNVLRKADNFGILAGENAVRLSTVEGGMRLEYTVMRIATPQAFDNYRVGVTLNEIKILKDADGDFLFWTNAGDIYVRARVADNYVGEILRQQVTALPEAGTTAVTSGHYFLNNPVELYNEQGLPPFLFIEVDVFEDDEDIITEGRSGDDVLGVVPVMLTNRWLRQHIGENSFEYTLTGNDTGTEKCRVKFTVVVWDPNEVPI